MRKVYMIFGALLILTACGSAPQSDQPDSELGNSDISENLNNDPEVQQGLLEIKDYSLGNTAEMLVATEDLLNEAQTYFDLAEAVDFDYQKMEEENSEKVGDLVGSMRDYWLNASLYYELNEGIVAGTPSLAEFDVLLDAGPSAEEDPVEALDWTLELDNGTDMESPGNIFHSLLEPVLWNDQELPEAYLLLATSEELHNVTLEMQSAISEWEPTIEDAFTALATMTPTMNEYFDQWKLSVYVAGSESVEGSFVAVSRLFDITGILEGLIVTYEKVGPLVAEVDSVLDQKITSGFETLDTYVSDLYERELNGEEFTAEEAEEYGVEAQNLATDLAGEITQAAELLDVEVGE